MNKLVIASLIVLLLIIFSQLALWMVILAVVLALLFVAFVYHPWRLQALERRRLQVEIDVSQKTVLHHHRIESGQLALEFARVQMERERLLVSSELAHRRVLVPEGQTVVFTEGNRYIPIQSPRYTTQKAQSIDASLESNVDPPTQSFLLEQLPENSLLVSPGIRASTGEVVRVDITEIPHLKIIGSSGFGKSCLAAALLDQLTTLNSPDLLQIALLDLEHKTSRLFEERRNLAELKVGTRRVPMLATNADEVAAHLGLLKGELDRRARLAEDDLDRMPVLLTYVEEMLSLQYEIEDEDILEQMLKHLSILAVRGRKYRMFLLCCTQTDYSTNALKTAQKQFRFRAAGGIDVTAARAAGFMNTELIKQNFRTGKPGQGHFVVEFPSFSGIVLAPRYDWKAQLRGKKQTFSSSFQDVLTDEFETPLKPARNTVEITHETSVEARVAQVRALHEKGWGKVAILEKIWCVKPGGSSAYKQAEVEYVSIANALLAEEG